MAKLSGLAAALDAAKTQSELARICGVTQPTVWGWLNRGSNKLPAEYVLKVEKETGVSRHLLRPDIYPVEDRAA